MSRHNDLSFFHQQTFDTTSTTNCPFPPTTLSTHDLHSFLCVLGVRRHHDHHHQCWFSRNRRAPFYKYHPRREEVCCSTASAINVRTHMIHKATCPHCDLLLLLLLFVCVSCWWRRPRKPKGHDQINCVFLCELSLDPRRISPCGGLCEDSQLIRLFCCRTIISFGIPCTRSVFSFCHIHLYYVPLSSIRI